MPFSLVWCECGKSMKPQQIHLNVISWPAGIKLARMTSLWSSKGSEESEMSGLTAKQTAFIALFLVDYVKSTS